MRSENGVYGEQFTSIVVRCTRKLLNVVDHKSAQRLNLTFIVRGIHEFFKAHDPLARTPGAFVHTVPGVGVDNNDDSSHFDA